MSVKVPILLHIVFIFLFSGCITKQHIIVPESPVDGQLKGIIEIGSFGLNAFIVLVDGNNNWALKNSKYARNEITNDCKVENMKDTIHLYLSDFKKFNISSKHIYFVISSGALKEPKNKFYTQFVHEIGYDIHEITAEQEGYYSFIATIPNTLINKSFIVDMGSTNTQIAWIKNNEIKVLETVGSKYKQKNILDNEAFDEVYEKASNIPKSNRRYCFIIGGVPYLMAKENRLENERYTTLKKADNYCFHDERSLSGLNLYKAIQSSTNCNHFIFDWDSNFAIGFLLTQTAYLQKVSN